MSIPSQPVNLYSYLSEDAARARLSRMCAATADPVLDDAALDELLTLAKRPYTVPRADLMQLTPAQAGLSVEQQPWGDVAFPVWLPDHAVTLSPDVLASWQPQTAYAQGVQIVPARRNKYVYTATTGGTSGASEPVWPLANGGTVTDGGVVWQIAGLSWMPTWDLNAAAAEGWRWKAALAAGRYDFGGGQARLARSQVVAQCLKMAQQFARKSMGSVVIPGKHPRSDTQLERERESIFGWESIGRSEW